MTIPSPLWRLILVISAVLASQGGALHPSSDGSDPLREELAVMTASDTWVPAHVLLLVATALLAFALWGAARSQAFRPVSRSAKMAAVAVSLFVVEATMHLLAVVDSDNLAHGESAPVAMTHIVLAAFLYPASGLTIALLSLDLARAWPGARKLVAVPGVIGGLVHAGTVPATLVLPEAEITPFFAIAGMSIALWTLLLAILTPRNRTEAAASRETAPATA
jgi:hypothetical protein